MRLSRLFAPHISLEVTPNVARMATFRLMERMDLVAYRNAGLYALLPLGSRVLRKIRQFLHTSSEREGLQEVDFPALQPSAHWRKSGRWQLFNDQIIRLASPYDALIATPTNEEFLFDLLSVGLQSYRQLPLRLYQIGDVFKGNTPSKGVIRSLVFEVYEAYSIDADEDGVLASRVLFERLFSELFQQLGLDVIKLVYPEGTFVNYLLPHESGEHTLNLTADGAVAVEQPGHTDRKIRALSIGMYKVFDRDFSRIMNSFYIDAGNRSAIPIMATYGIGLSRLLFAVVDQGRNGIQMVWPRGFEPFDYAIVSRQRDNEAERLFAEETYHRMISSGVSVLLDDRYGRHFRDKVASLQLIGIPRLITFGAHSLPDVTLIDHERSYRTSIDAILDASS